MDIEHVITLIMGAGGAMGLAIGVLFRTVMSLHTEHRQMLREHAEIMEQVGKLKGQQDGIERLSADVLETVHRAIGRHHHERDSYVSDFKNDTSIEEIRRKTKL